MALFGKSLDALHREAATIQMAIEERAKELSMDQSDMDATISGLMPLSTKLTKIKRTIRDRTPRRKLMADVEDFKQQLKALPPQDSRDLADMPFEEVGPELQLRSQRMTLQNEISLIDFHLKHTNNDPFNLKRRLWIYAAAAGAYVLWRVLFV